ncbi:MAG: hypothetical protein M3Z04_05455 [Chloroflexota bacterium]|nr:hypothetical protein [Chloroflexota bacterium]
MVRLPAVRWPRRGAWWLLALILLLGAGLVPASRAAHAEAHVYSPVPQTAGLAMSVEAGYDGHYKIGEWFPVRVGLTNTGAAVDGEVQVDAGNQSGNSVATYAYPVSLPAPSRKTITLYTYGGGYQHDITVRLLRGGTVLLEQKANINPLNDAFLLGVVSDTPDLLNSLSGTRLGSTNGGTTTTVAHLAPADVPTLAPALAALDALVVADTDTGKWTPEQRAAVAGWAVAGGTLVVAGGANAGAAAGLADLLPAQMAASQTLGDLSALGAYTGGTAPAADGALASRLQLRTDLPGAVVAVAGPDGPLLAQRPLGQGAVFALALDPALPPLRTWDRATPFWQTVFAGHQTGMSLGAMRRTNNNYNSAPYYTSSLYGNNLSPFDIPALQLPSVATIGVFLLLYVVVVGPFNWFILRRRQRPDWAWLTIPAIILLFAGLAYALGYGSKGSALRLTTGTVVQTYPGAPVATVSSFAGLFSPNRQAYDLEWDAAATLSEINEQGNANRAARLYTGRPSAVRDVQIDTWALRGFLAETSLPIPAPFSGRLQLGTGTVSGRITNTGNAPLRDVAVVLGDEARLLGTLAPGAGADVQITVSSGSNNIERLLGQLLPGFQSYSYPPPNGAADRLRARKAALLTTGLVAGSDLAVTVLGWADSQPLAVRVPGQNPVRDDLVLVTTRLPLDTGQGRVVLGPGLLPRTLVNAGGQAQGGTPDFSDMELSPDTVFQYRLPAGITVDQLGLDYDLLPQSGTGTFRLEAYNWDKAAWEAAQDSDGKPIGDHATFKGNLTAPATYVGKEGLLRLRLLPAGGGSAYIHFNRFDLSVEGHR